ncbi:MAG: DUF2269 family protein [Gaiellaceae bacterium]
MTTSQWLLMFHVTGAFLFIGGSVAAAVLYVLAIRAERPSETALLLRTVRWTIPLIGLGVLLTLVLGLWLVDVDGYRYGSFWVIAAIVLWLIANALGGRGGRQQQKARELAERLAAEGDTSTDELRALLRDPKGNAMSWLAGLAALLILVDMFWKPGA